MGARFYVQSKLDYQVRFARNLPNLNENCDSFFLMFSASLQVDVPFNHGSVEWS